MKSTMKKLYQKLLPYNARTKLHHVLEWLDRTGKVVEYRICRLAGKHDALLPPPWMRSVGTGDYQQIGDEFFRYFVELGGLRQDDRVLDVGCGTGRMARPLTAYLTQGSYEGIDIVEPSIRWCQSAFTPRFPRFRFLASDIYNKDYHPGGKISAAEYRFPFESASFDFVFLTSVFTHMLPADLENYVSEISRVLKPEGRCLITYFLLNETSCELLKTTPGLLSFQHFYPGCRIENKDLPENVVAYAERDIRDLYGKYGLKIAEPIRFGTWSGRTDGLSYQDIVLATRNA